MTKPFDFPQLYGFRIIEDPYLAPDTVLVVDGRALDRYRDLLRMQPPKLLIEQLPPTDTEFRWRASLTMPKLSSSLFMGIDWGYVPPPRRVSRRQLRKGEVNRALLARRERMARKLP
jgi:hypothetical protein